MDAILSPSGRRRPPRRPAGRGGFTLLEVVVATSILIVLTLMIGSLFRQATSAWNTGRVRGEGSMIARGVMGSVSRDLATAIDGRPYGFADGGPVASGGTLQFVCLKASDSEGSSVHKIVYTVSRTSATRHDSVWRDGSGFQSTGDAATLFSISSRDSPVESAEFELVGATAGSNGRTRPFEKTGGPQWTGATAVKLRIKLSQKGAFSSVSVRSLGKNGKEDEHVIVAN